MSVTIASFRGAFPAFKDIQCYPDPEITFWLSLSEKLHDQNRWGDLLDFGKQLFVAHNLSLEFNAKSAASVGNNPGEVIGPTTSGSVDKVSYGRDLGGVMDPKAGHWNLSTYGLRYLRLVRMVGAGPIYAGAPSIAELSQVPNAWPGPYPWPNPSN